MTTPQMEILQGEVHELESKLKDARKRLQAICTHKKEDGKSAWRYRILETYYCQECCLVKEEDDLTEEELNRDS